MLWSHPRSVSSAMERIMLERGDLTNFHEPFIYLYYVGDGKKKPWRTLMSILIIQRLTSV